MATYRTRNGKTQVRIVTPDGRQVAKTFPNKTRAKVWATAMEADLARGTYVDQRAGETIFDTYAIGWLEERKRRLAPGTWKRDTSYLRSLILPTFGDRAIKSIRPSDLSSWIAKLDCKESTKACAFQITRSILERARLDKAIAANPADDVQGRPAPKRTQRPGRALGDTELALVVQAAYETDAASAFIVVVLARLGLRIGEALGLRRDDFDLAAGTVTVQRSRDRDGSFRPLKARHTGDHRVIPLPRDVAEAYQRHIATQKAVPIGGDLFVTSKSTPMSYHNWRRRQWLPIVERADIGHLVPHDLRHTCITRLFIVDRWTPTEVQAFVGHTDARVTLDIYSHVNPSELPVPSEFRLR